MIGTISYKILLLDNVLDIMNGINGGLEIECQRCIRIDLSVPAEVESPPIKVWKNAHQEASR